ncbi:MAG: ribonuclease HI family protein [Patescibacteria group bacterium]
MNKIIIYTDGGSRGNPGPSAIGIVIKNDKEEILKTYGEKIGIGTNNEAEYKAIIFALQKAKLLLGKTKTKQLDVHMKMDSELAVKQLTGEYKLMNENIQRFFIEIHNLKTEFKNVTFEHIRREFNKEADRALNDALDK